MTSRSLTTESVQATQPPHLRVGIGLQRPSRLQASVIATLSAAALHRITNAATPPRRPSQSAGQPGEIVAFSPGHG